jgi:predicted molibdopterin-dependent oxidoreductase YjgC
MLGNERRSDLRTTGIPRGERVSVTVDGREVNAFESDTVLGLLWSLGIHSLRKTARRNEPRGFFCGMGVCFDCLVTVNGRLSVRACLEPVRAGMHIECQQDAGGEASHGAD